MKTDSRGVPDLLRRFVETPFAERFASGDVTFEVKTNDLALLTEVRQALVLQKGFETELSTWNWKLIRDETAPRAGKELTILRSGPLSMVQLGMGTLIAVDHERCEVLGFIAPDVSAEEFVSGLLPVMIGLLRHDSLAASSTIVKH